MERYSLKSKVEQKHLLPLLVTAGQFDLNIHTIVFIKVPKICASAHS